MSALGLSAALAVGAGAALGAPLRYLTDRRLAAALGDRLPWGTLTVNVVGSAVLGLVLSLAAHHDVPGWIVPALGTGFCGALTTFSTYAVDTDGLWRRGARMTALGYATGSVGCGLVACALGWWCGTW